jgi:hypothetical protein
VYMCLTGHCVDLAGLLHFELKQTSCKKIRTLKNKKVKLPSPTPTPARNPASSLANSLLHDNMFISS